MSASPECYGIIPARFSSSRFPGKPLADILGKPMFWHVYQRAIQCPEMKQVVLATDDQWIANAAKRHQVPVIMTSEDHPTGTDRVLEAAEELNVPDEAVIVNIQGDEPTLEPKMLSQLLMPFEAEKVRVATLARKLAPREAQTPDRVKVVCDRKGWALYFSRARIPYPREGFGEFFIHIGLYGFRMETLRRFAQFSPGRLEHTEKLEQLRFLENGVSIYVSQTEYECLSVDRPEDLDEVVQILQNQQEHPSS